MAVKKIPAKAAKKPAPKKAPAIKAVKKSATKPAATKVPAKKAAPAKKQTSAKTPVKKAISPPVKEIAKAKATHPVKKSTKTTNIDSPKKTMITKSKTTSGKRMADEKPKKTAAPEKPTVKKEEPVRMTRKLLVKDDPKAIIDAVPLQPIKPFTRTDVKNFTVQEKLQTIYYLQQIHSHIDHINIIRGELPMEVKDLVEEVNLLQSRVTELKNEIQNTQNEIARHKLHIKEATAQIKKYESQQMNVKNNREYDSLSKEIEFQQLDIQLSEKRIKEHTYDLKLREDDLAATETKFEERKATLEQKQRELDAIVAETIKEEQKLEDQAANAEKLIDINLLNSYQRIRKSMANGLAVVKIERDSCGGCFNKVPPQLQLELSQRKRFTFCEHCGRLIVDANIDNWD